MKVRLKNTRSCGDCRLCCTILEVKEGLEEGGKVTGVHAPEHTPCQWECSAGCGIYASRPQTCRDFQCVWLAEGELPKASRVFRDSERPDSIGAVPVYSSDDLHTKWGLFAVILHHLPGRTHGSRRVARRIARHMAVILVEGDSRKVRGPREVLGRWQQAIQLVWGKKGEQT